MKRSLLLIIPGRIYGEIRMSAVVVMLKIILETPFLIQEIYPKTYLSVSYCQRAGATVNTCACGKSLVQPKSMSHQRAIKTSRSRNFVWIFTLIDHCGKWPISRGVCKPGTTEYLCSVQQCAIYEIPTTCYIT